MSTDLISEAGSDTHSPLSAPERERRRRRLLSAPAKVLAFLWKYLVGMVLCQNPLGSLLVVGWTYRLVQRSVLKRWWKRSGLRRQGIGFREFLASTESSAPPGRLESLPHKWPNWIVQHDLRRELRRRLGRQSGVVRALRCVFAALVGSLWLNLKLGFQVIFNTWVLTLPACVLWLFAWHHGWTNSFHKGYEQAQVGPLTGLLGVALFIVAMMYVPLAQVRQVAAGSWRAFYQFGLVWRLMRQRWLGCMGLAALYSALSLPVTVLKTAPAFFPQAHPPFEDMSDAQLLHFLQVYFFWACAVVLPCYVALRLATARLYASAMLASVQKGLVSPAELGSGELQVLTQLDLLHHHERPRRHVLIRTTAWTSRKIAVATVGTFIVFMWFTFVAQIFIGEFINYHPGIGWLNQPLVQLPWFRYIPTHLSG